MMRESVARDLAGKALAMIAEQPETLARFLALTGIGPATLRLSAARPEFAGAVLDFLLTDEALARGFAGLHGLAPEALMAARAALPGGDAPHWT
jgi:hypothetical protein